MIHSGSRGLIGHQVATDALLSMENAMKSDNIETNDRQLACARIHSQVSNTKGDCKFFFDSTHKLIKQIKNDHPIHQEIVRMLRSYDFNCMSMVAVSLIDCHFILNSIG
jgi:hypothetical protein